MNLVDTPGVDGKENPMRKLKEIKEELFKRLGINEFDLLVCCIRISPGVRMKENEAIITAIHNFHGKEIWKRCVIAFTFSNELIDELQDDYQDQNEVKRTFRSLAEEHITYLQQVLIKMKVELHFAELQTIFSWVAADRGELSPEDVVLGIPAGLETGDQVLPGIKMHEGEGWTDKIFIEMLNKSKKKESLAHSRYGFNIPPRIKNLLWYSGTAAAGAAGGAFVGTVFGPFGTAIGAAVGGAIGSLIARAR